MLHRGRPVELKDPVNFTIRIERALLEAARDAAWERRVTLSEIVREAFAALAKKTKRSRVRGGDK